MRDFPFFANLLFCSALISVASFAACRASSVEWFIGDEDGRRRHQSEKKEEYNWRTVREGVEVYSNGDSYEGEFHCGWCTGSGLYRFFAAKGRYEGDWVDGKYDGHGIETWRGEAGTGGNTSRAYGTGSGCICSIAGTATSASEPAVRVTGSACRDAPTAVATLGISRPASSMKSAATISGMVTSILESILVIRYMVLESIALLMVTVMKVHGMRARNKVLDYTHSGLARQDQAIGIVEL